MKKYNVENLKPFAERTEKEQRDIRVMGGKASGEARRKKKTMKEMLKLLLEEELVSKKGTKKTALEMVMTSMINQALKGNVKATTFIRDTIGEKPENSNTIYIESSDGLKVNLDLVKQMNEHFCGEGDETDNG